MEPPLRLIYLIGSYPWLTTTFIDREIRTLREWGVELDVIAIRRPPPDMPFSADQRELQQSVTYLLPAPLWRLVLSQLYYALVRPWRYWSTLVFLLTRKHPKKTARLLSPRFMTLMHFGIGVYAAYILRKRDLVELHAHFVDRSATVALTAGRLLHKPYSLSIHAGPDIFVDPVLLREKILEARHVVTCTSFNKAHIEGIIGQDLSDKITHIPHGLDPTRYNPHPYQPPANGHRVMILSVGQLTERKGFVPLIKACRRLKDQGYDLICQIVGQGPQLRELSDLIQELSLTNTVTLCGALPHEAVIEKNDQATLFCLPCVQSKAGNLDGIPNVLPEAMAMQRPVISTTLSGIPELVDHEMNGLLVPPGDVDALVAAIARLLDDPALCQRLGENGRQAVLERFDIRHNIKRFAATLWPDWFPSPSVEPESSVAIATAPSTF